jgi:hypothetical protein
MELNTILNLLTTIVVIVGAIFGVVQLILIKKQRKRESALQLINSIQTNEFMEGMNIIYNLPSNLSKDEIEQQLGIQLKQILIMFAKIESLGLLVHRRELNLKLINDFIGGPILMFWKTMKNYFLEIRQTEGKENFGEWVQWLAEQLEKKEAIESKIPAHIAYKDWIE